MPSTATITAFYNFTSGTIYSSEVKNNFDAIRGHFCPIDASTAALANMSYDLGSYDHAWRNLYSRGNFLIATTTGDVPGTTTAFNIYAKSSDSRPYWRSSSTDKALMFNGDSIPTSQLTGTVAIANGGTNISTYTKGDILYCDTAGSLAKLTIGTTGQTMVVKTDLTPGWTTAAASTGLPNAVGTASPNSVTSVTISGLNGDSDGCWRVVIRGQWTGSDAIFMYVRPNGDTGNNYRGVCYFEYDNGATISLATTITGAIIMRKGYADLNTLHINLRMTAETGRIRNYSAETGWYSAQPSGGYQYAGGGWNNTATTITSLDFNFGGGTFVGTINVYPDSE